MSRVIVHTYGHGFDGTCTLAEEPDEVVIGIETDRGLFVGALVAAGYQV